jgi:hypothetical protein
MDVKLDGKMEKWNWHDVTLGSHVWGFEPNIKLPE